MSTYRNLPVPAAGDGLTRYLQEIRRFPMLEESEEYMLAKRYAEHGDAEAARKLITSHLRLSAKIAMGYRGYGLPTADVISEGNIGLMQAVKRFDPEKGFRLSTYAVWWIKAAIQEYILKSWSLVKIGTTSAQKKLFFNLRRLKGHIGAHEEGDLKPENVKRISDELKVPEKEVVSMNRRLAGPEGSLNAKISSDDGASMEWQDWLVDENADHAAKYERSDELAKRKMLLGEALKSLDDRERDIIISRNLQEKPIQLESLSQKYKISKERVRQIELASVEKLKREVTRLSAPQALAS